MRSSAITFVALFATLTGCDEGSDPQLDTETSASTQTGADTDAPSETDGDTDDTDGDTDGDVGESTGSTELSCDAQPVITYDTFGRGFLATYCDGCHGSEAANRQGAPANVVFDTRDGAMAFAERILARSAPADGSAPTMPPAGGITPDDLERLEIWLACYP